MTVVVSKAQQELNARIEEVREEITRLKAKLAQIDAELEALAAERERVRLVEEVCERLERLEQEGAAHLFWGRGTGAEERAAHLEHARATVSEFGERLAAIERRRAALQEQIDEKLRLFDWLNDELFERQEEEENIKYEFVVHREVVLPYRPVVMPWTEEREDRARFRKTLLLVLLVTLCFSTLVGLWQLPPPEPADPTEIPERLVRLVQRELPKPPPPKPVEQREVKPVKPEEKPKPTQTETQQARAKAQKSGILAFSNTFADLVNEADQLKLGAEAQATIAGEKSVGAAQRSLVVARAHAGSGGINTAAISRNIGGGAGSRMGGVEFTRVASSVGDIAEADRPLSDGPGPSRTDEEIQIVFDRYKAALYRLYNRELRSNPLLRGKIVLRITIEPSGEVSACTIESSDLPSETLKAEVVARVKRFNFGPKEGVPRITILYPIDFLPAT